MRIRARKHSRNVYVGADGTRYTRESGITDWMHNTTCEKYGRKDIDKDDIFYYTYGILHYPLYREKYQNNFKKELPRIPLVERYEDFCAFSWAGRELGELHCKYEHVKMNSTAQICINEGADTSAPDFYDVVKMRPVGGDRFTELRYNDNITIKNIPTEAHDYIVNGRSPLGWIIDQYRVKIDKQALIKNDPNDWGREHGNPRYILDLILRVIEVSVRTMKIIDELPKVDV